MKRLSMSASHGSLACRWCHRSACTPWQIAHIDKASCHACHACSTPCLRACVLGCTLCLWMQMAGNGRPLTRLAAQSGRPQARCLMHEVVCEVFGVPDFVTHVSPNLGACRMCMAPPARLLTSSDAAPSEPHRHAARSRLPSPALRRPPEEVSDSPQELGAAHTPVAGCSTPPPEAATPSL